MKKTLLKTMAMSIFFVALVTTFAACTELSEAEKEIVGKYELIEVSISGYPSITANTYEYFTIEFFSDKKCNIKSKAGTTEYDANAEWKVNSDGELEVITKQGFAKSTEKYRYEDGIISGTNSTIIDGSSVSATMSFKKITE